MLVVIDNYDSFVHNLARYIRVLGWETLILRNDAASVREVRELRPSHILISPGPRSPDEAGVSMQIIRELGPEIPILGVCLGHQCIGQAYGGRVGRARRPMHGKASQVRHEGRGLFAGLPNPLTCTRYHSLVVEPEALPAELEVTATSEEGEIMALRHRHHPVLGLQFHPEAVLTEYGFDLLRHFLRGEPDRVQVA